MGCDFTIILSKFIQERTISCNLPHLWPCIPSISFLSFLQIFWCGASQISELIQLKISLQIQMINFHFNQLSDQTHLIVAQTLEKKWGRAWENKGGEDTTRTATLTTAHSYIDLSLSINHRVRYPAVIILHVSINCSFPAWEKRGWRSQMNTIHFDWQLVALNFPLSTWFFHLFA